MNYYKKLNCELTLKTEPRVQHNQSLKKMRLK